MKLFALFVGGLLAAASLTACGAGEESTAAEKPRLEMSAKEISELPPVKVSVASGPAPRKLLISDLREGDGAVMKRGDAVLIDWAEVSYGDASGSTVSLPVRQLKFSFGKYIEGWERGLPGMKVGGRRELIVPPRLGDTGTTTVYAIDLLGIERG